MPLADYFWNRVDRQEAEQCWAWTGKKDRQGYGHIWNRKTGKTTLAHRYSWELANGRTADGVVCHSCDNPSCVNPAHLRLGTQSENIREAVAKGRWPRMTGRCQRGHEFTPENTIPSQGRRRCRICREASNRKARERKLESAQ